VAGGGAATGNHSRRRKHAGRDEDSSHVLETQEHSRKRERAVREKVKGRERIFFENEMDLSFPKYMGLRDSVCACLLYYRAPSRPQPMICDQMAYSSPSIDQIRTVWSPSDKLWSTPVFRLVTLLGLLVCFCYPTRLFTFTHLQITCFIFFLCLFNLFLLAYLICFF
jgi:hypothetical protein